MVGKSTVSALGEFCAKKNITAPSYECINAEDSGYICEVTVMDHFTGRGQGRSKRDAKHQAAASVIKRLRREYPEIDEIPQMEIEELPSKDVVMVLRDYCVQKNHPLPNIEIVQQGGTPDAPQFTAKCTLATICRLGVSEKKKDARQKAAYEMLRTITEQGHNLEHELQIISLGSAVEDVENERYKKFKTYRELTDSKSGHVPGVLLCDRHNYFKNFYDPLKEEALAILKSKSYESTETKVYDVLNALKIKPKIEIVNNLQCPGNPMLFITLNCDYDAAFIGNKDEIYSSMITYFQIMLA